MRLKKDTEKDAMDAELEADIPRTIPDRISEVYVRPFSCESMVIS